MTPQEEDARRALGGPKLYHARARAALPLLVRQADVADPERVEAHEARRDRVGDRPVADWFNRTAPQVKAGEIDPDNMDEQTALLLMIDNPILIRRPLMQVDDRYHYVQLQQGKGEDEIRRYMTDRYGDFVRYRPPLQARTVLLWVGPALLLAGGLLALGWQLRRRQRWADDAFEPDPELPETPETSHVR